MGQPVYCRISKLQQNLKFQAQKFQNIRDHLDFSISKFQNFKISVLQNFKIENFGNKLPENASKKKGENGLPSENILVNNHVVD